MSYELINESVSNSLKKPSSIKSLKNALSTNKSLTELSNDYLENLITKSVRTQFRQGIIGSALINNEEVYFNLENKLSDYVTLRKAIKVYTEINSLSNNIIGKLVNTELKIELTDAIMKTFNAVKQGANTADEIALKTGRSRTVESTYLNSLQRMNLLSKKRRLDGYTEYFVINDTELSNNQPSIKLGPKTEEYYDMIVIKGESSAIRLAEELNKSRTTVTTALNKLYHTGLVGKYWNNEIIFFPIIKELLFKNYHQVISELKSQQERINEINEEINKLIEEL